MILGSICAFLNWKWAEIRPQFWPRKIPDEYFDTQCRPGGDAAKCKISSGYALFCQDEKIQAIILKIQYFIDKRFPLGS